MASRFLHVPDRCNIWQHLLAAARICNNTTSLKLGGVAIGFLAVAAENSYMLPLQEALYHENASEESDDDFEGYSHWPNVSNHGPSKI